MAETWIVEFWNVDTERFVMYWWTDHHIIHDFRNFRLGGYDIVEVETPTCISYPDGGLRRIKVKEVPLPEKGPDRYFFDLYGQRLPGKACPHDMYETDWDRHRAKFDENGNLKEEFKNDKEKE